MQGCAPACFECGMDSHHEHHVVPRSRGGTKTVPLCTPCHGLAHEKVMGMPHLIREGIARARATKKGGRWGAPRTLPYPTIERMYFEEGVSIADISRKLKLKYHSVSTVIRRLNKQAKNKA